MLETWFLGTSKPLSYMDHILYGQQWGASPYSLAHSFKE